MTTVFFATNRAKRGAADFSDGFHENPDELRFGTAELAGEGLYREDLAKLAGAAKVTIASENLKAKDPARIKLGSIEVFKQVRAAMELGKDAVLFVHGFNFSFRESVARAAQVQQWLASGGHDMVVMMFGWPSRGAGVGPSSYRDDRMRAKASGLALGRAILKATDFIRSTARAERCDGRIHLLAHSMGNWALSGAIQSMRTFVGSNIPPLFDEVLLMAADEDADTLADAKKMGPLLRGCRRVTVYYNQQDLALKASDVAMGNPDRLGRSGPAGTPERPEKVCAVNVSPTIQWEGKEDEPWTGDETGHQYYRNNEIVLKDAAQVLDGLLDPDIAGRTKRDAYYRLG